MLDFRNSRKEFRLNRFILRSSYFLLFFLLGCGNLTVSVVDTFLNSPKQLSLKINGLQAPGNIAIPEGYGLVIVLSLSEATENDIDFQITLSSSNKFLIQDHFSAAPGLITIPAGQSTGSLILSSLDNTYYYQNNTWDLEVKSINPAYKLNSGLTLTIDDNDSLAALPPFAGGPNCTGGASYLQNSGSQTNGEYLFVVSADKINCFYSFTVKGSGGGSSYNAALGGNGGKNSFLFQPGQTGVFRIVVGGGGKLAVGNYGGPGGGASSVLFDPDAVADLSDAFMLSIAGGGGGSGSGYVNEHGGAGGGDGPGTSSPRSGGIDGGGAPGDGTGGVSIDSVGGTCSALCQGGKGGDSYDTSGVAFAGGFGKGSGNGGQVTFGGGGGGGYGGGGGARWNLAGGGGAGKVFNVNPPATLTNITEATSSLGGGGKGGSATNSTDGEDGSVALTIN